MKKTGYWYQQYIDSYKNPNQSIIIGDIMRTGMTEDQAYEHLKTITRELEGIKK